MDLVRNWRDTANRCPNMGTTLLVENCADDLEHWLASPELREKIVAVFRELLPETLLAKNVDAAKRARRVEDDL
jgi:hypothetical protein